MAGCCEEDNFMFGTIYHNSHTHGGQLGPNVAQRVAGNLWNCGPLTHVSLINSIVKLTCRTLLIIHLPLAAAVVVVVVVVPDLLYLVRRLADWVAVAGWLNFIIAVQNCRGGDRNPPTLHNCLAILHPIPFIDSLFHREQLLRV